MNQKHTNIVRVEKLKQERSDLFFKITGLRFALNHDELLSRIPDNQIALMKSQLPAMEKYEHILTQRIEDGLKEAEQ